jgi:pimeloyl-ACP methyl ester carboxylesterase
MEPSRRPGGVAAALDRVVPGGVTGQRLRIDDRTLSCVAAGHGAPVVVLEAGRNDNALSWAAVILLLAPHVRVVAYDRAGLGDSDLASSPASIDRQVTDLATVIRRRAGGRCVLAGHSWGGLLAQLLAASHPGLVAGLILVDPAHIDAAVVLPFPIGGPLAALPRCGQHSPDPDCSEFSSIVMGAIWPSG